MRAIQIAENGGPEAMGLANVAVPQPEPGQVRMTVAAAGVNFIDTYHRSGVYPVDLPFTIGKEASGTISAVGEGVEGFAVGDRVVTPLAEGSYADECLAGADLTYRLPDAVDFEIGAAAALQGLTAQYLTSSTYPLQPGDRCLVHAGAGGVGGLVIQMAKRRGAEVFTTVGTADKALIANEAGADHVIIYTEEDFGEAVRRITSVDRPLHVVYDGIGKDTFDAGLDLLRLRGMMVLFGAASGQVPPFDLQRLNAGGSLFITRPSLGHYLQPPEGQQRADELYGWVASGDLKVRIGASYPLEQAADAHRALEGRATTGKVLLVP